MAVTSGSDPNAKEMAALAALMGGSGGGGLGGGKVYMGSERYTKGGNGDKGSGQELPRGKTMYGTKDLWAIPGGGLCRTTSIGRRQEAAGLHRPRVISAACSALGDGPMEGSKLWKKLTNEARCTAPQARRSRPFDIMASYVKASGGGANAWHQQGVWSVNTVTGERRYSRARVSTWAGARPSRRTRAWTSRTLTRPRPWPPSSSRT
jgi:hypothetical protein